MGRLLSEVPVCVHPHPQPPMGLAASGHPIGQDPRARPDHTESPVHITHSFCDISQVRGQRDEAWLQAGCLPGVWPSGPWATRPRLSLPSSAQ